MKVISLLTDFGMKDGYVGVMKGVIWTIAPDARIADITHEIEPQNIFEGALALKRSAPYFPDGSVHIGVVDPGVGTLRRPIAARVGKHYFVGPDNGLATLLFDWAIEKHLSTSAVHIVELNRPEFWLQKVSSSFHGRDIFAPVGAHLANGVPLSELGSDVTEPIRLEMPRPIRTHTGWQGQIIHIDRFGNAATNINAECLQKYTVASVRTSGLSIDGLSETYGDRQPGETVAMLDSDGLLAITVVNGSAAQLYRLRSGDPVEIIFAP